MSQARKPDEPKKPGEPAASPSRRPRRRNAAPPNQNQNCPRRCGKYYEESPGYANYWFNRYHQQRVWNAYLAHGDFAETGWNWNITGKTRPAATCHRAHRKERSHRHARRPVGRRVRPVAHRNHQPAAFRRVAGRAAPVAAAAPVRPATDSAKSTTSARALDNRRQAGRLPRGHHRRRRKRDSTSTPTTAIWSASNCKSSDDEDPARSISTTSARSTAAPCPIHWTIRHGDDVFADLKITSYDWTSSAKPPKAK